MINGTRVNFEKGESIHTENSHKYSEQSFLNLASQAGLKLIKSWSDQNKLFRIYYLVPAS